MYKLTPEYQKAWRLTHPEQTREHGAKYRAKMKKIAQSNPNDPRVISRKATNRRCLANFRANNPNYIAEYTRKKRQSDPGFKLMGNLRNRLNDLLALNPNSESESAKKLLGCSIKSFLIYIESKFEIGMNWENHGRGKDKWHLDHIIPCALFDLSNPDHMKYCFHFSNLQPMWQTPNLSKGKKCPEHLLQNLSSLYEQSIEGN